MNLPIVEIRALQALLATILLMPGLQALAAPKTDILIFKNGDRLTGELKSLKRGQLSFNTDATGTIGIEWDKVAQIISKQRIQVGMASGARYFGTLLEPAKDGDVIVETAEGALDLQAGRIITMQPIEEKGLSAFDVDLTFGYNFAKSTGVKQGTFGLDVDYRTRLRVFAFDVLTTVSDSNSQEARQRQSLGFQFTRLWTNRWVSNGNVSLEQNDELGLNLRTSIGFGGGRFVVQSNSMLLLMQAGLQASRENLISEQEDTDSVEMVLSADWDWFKFNAPELDWSTKIQIIPSLTEKDRVRGEFDTSLKWEIVNDLKLGMSIYSSFDSQPQSDLAATSDYGVNTTVTYEF